VILSNEGLLISLVQALKVAPASLQIELLDEIRSRLEEEFKNNPQSYTIQRCLCLNSLTSNAQLKSQIKQQINKKLESYTKKPPNRGEEPYLLLLAKILDAKDIADKGFVKYITAHQSQVSEFVTTMYKAKLITKEDAQQRIELNEAESSNFFGSYRSRIGAWLEISGEIKDSLMNNFVSKLGTSYASFQLWEVAEELGNVKKQNLELTEKGKDQVRLLEDKLIDHFKSLISLKSEENTSKNRSLQEISTIALAHHLMNLNPKRVEKLILDNLTELQKQSLPILHKILSILLDYVQIYRTFFTEHLLPTQTQTQVLTPFESLVLQKIPEVLASIISTDANLYQRYLHLLTGIKVLVSPVTLPMPASAKVVNNANLIIVRKLYFKYYPEVPAQVLAVVQIVTEAHLRFVEMNLSNFGELFSINQYSDEELCKTLVLGEIGARKLQGIKKTFENNGKFSGTLLNRIFNILVTIKKWAPTNNEKLPTKAEIPTLTFMQKKNKVGKEVDPVTKELVDGLIDQCKDVIYETQILKLYAHNTMILSSNIINMINYHIYHKKLTTEELQQISKAIQVIHLLILGSRTVNGPNSHLLPPEFNDADLELCHHNPRDKGAYFGQISPTPLEKSSHPTV